MKRLTLAVDMDSILVDLLGHWLQAIEDDTGVRISTDQVLDWDMSSVAGLIPMDKEKVLAYLQRPGFFLEAPAMPGAIEALRNLCADHEVLIVSCPCSPNSAKEKLEWLAKWCPFISAKNVLLVGSGQKPRIKADVLIDDNPEILTSYKRAHPETLCTGIAYAYNRHLGISNGYFLCGSYQQSGAAWDDIVALVGVAALDT